MMGHKLGNSWTPILSIVIWMKIFTLSTTGVHSIEDPDSDITYLPLPAEITDPPTDQTSVEGKTVTLRCRAVGDPDPVVRWIRDGHQLTEEHYRILRTGDLEISSLTFVDAGNYTCLAENRLGSATQSARLVVKEHTRMLQSPMNMEVASDQTAILHCSAASDPTLNLTITWLRDRQGIEADPKRRLKQLGNNSLAIYMASVLDAGVYTCIASTELDEARAEATLVVQDRPNAPKITGMACNARNASISWRSMGDNRSPILCYAVEYNASFAPRSWEVAYNDVPSTENSYTAPVSPWANYTFRVIARNKIGPSQPSSYSEVCSTPMDVPFKNPDNVKGRGSRPDNLVISWTPMTDRQRNAPNFRYRIQWKLKDIRGRWDGKEITDCSRGNITIPNQPTYKPYLIKVRAMNERGKSKVEPVEVLGFSGQGKPLVAPENLTLLMEIDYKTVVVSWNPVPEETVRGKLEGYKVKYWTEGGDVSQVVTLNETNHAVVKNLVSLTKNYLQVLVYNSDYEGPPSETLEVIMKEGFPGPVELFQAVPLSQSALYLSWRKPLETNGSITGYDIYYETVKGAEVGLKTQRTPSNVGPERTSAKLWGLEGGMKYRVHIHAKTRRGEGPGSFTEESTYSQPAVSLTKSQLSWTLYDCQISLCSIRVKWKPRFGRPGRPGSHFYILYKRPDEQYAKSTPPELYEDFQDVRDLVSNETYVFRLVTVDGHVQQGSEPENVHTFLSGADVTSATAAVKVIEEEGSVFTKENDTNHTVVAISTAAGLIVAAAIILLAVLWRKYKVAVNVIRNLTKDEVDEFHFGFTKAEEDGTESSLESAPYNDNKVIRSQDLQIDSLVLGEGAFGIVHRGIYREKYVAVKSSKSSADPEYFKAFLKEIKVMAYIGDHENIVTFYGAVVDKIEERSCQAVMELCPFGDLNSFLRKHSTYYTDASKESISHKYENGPGQVNVLSHATLMGFCRQIAVGMNFLAQKRVIHGDLAARNVLVFNNGIAKITDFGLSRKLYNCANYTKKNAFPLPWRWMALESLSFFEFSTKSDVWSFGVTMWEVFSLGQVPFSGVNWNADFMDQLRSGFRLTKPQHCTPVVYNWMRRCWENDAEGRPTFAECLVFLSISNHVPSNTENEAYYCRIDR